VRPGHLLKNIPSTRQIALQRLALPKAIDLLALEANDQFGLDNPAFLYAQGVVRIKTFLDPTILSAAPQRTAQGIQEQIGVPTLQISLAANGVTVKVGMSFQLGLAIHRKGLDGVKLSRTRETIQAVGDDQGLALPVQHPFSPGRNSAQRQQ